jgi:hypothetical protein
MRHRSGLSFMGAKWSEEIPIGVALACEHGRQTMPKVEPDLLLDTQPAGIDGRLSDSMWCGQAV